MNSIKDGLQECLQLTQEIEALCADQDWAQVEAKLSIRDQKLSQYLEANIEASESAEIQYLVGEIKMINNILIKTITNHRDEVFSEIKKGPQGKKMKAAYERTRRPY